MTAPRPFAPPLRDYLGLRRAEVERLIADLDQSRDPLRAELEEIRRAALALDDPAPSPEPEPAPAPGAEPEPARPKPLKPGGQTQRVLTYLAQHPDGLRSGEIADALGIPSYAVIHALDVAIARGHATRTGKPKRYLFTPARPEGQP